MSCLLNPQTSRRDVPLSPLGEAEATAAAGWLKPYPLHSVFSSPLSRAVFGAEEIRKGRTNLAMPENVPLALPGFKEMARGAWRGMGPEDIGLEVRYTTMTMTTIKASHSGLRTSLLLTQPSRRSTTALTRVTSPLLLRVESLSAT